MNQKGRFTIVTALSIAMLGTTIVVMYGVLQAEAAPTWCYAVTGGNKCVADSTKKSDCIAASEADANAISPGNCFNLNKK